MNEDYFIAVDFHCKYQKVAWLNRATGKTGEADLEHAELEKLRQWYKAFRPGTVVGMEASGFGWWFEQLIQEVGLELKVGHPGHIARMRLRKQKNDRRDAEHLLGLLVREEFPQVWRPNPEQREQKILIRYRVKLMQERTRCVNTLRALVLAPLGAMGRMALTNYLLHTVIHAAIFFGVGLGLYGKVSPVAGVGITFLMYASMILLSVWWMERFRFGPAEWLWRTLTYAKLQPMLLRQASET